MDKDVQPRLADSSISFRATAAPNPCICEEADFNLVLPPATSGANAVMTLQVLFLGGLFSGSSRFFSGICQTPQADEDAIFKHPAVKAGVQVKWEGYARLRFYMIFGLYAAFVILFTVWSVTEGVVDPDATTGPSHGSTWSAAEGAGAAFLRSQETI